MSVPHITPSVHWLLGHSSELILMNDEHGLGQLDEVDEATLTRPMFCKH